MILQEKPKLQVVMYNQKIKCGEQLMFWRASVRKWLEVQRVTPSAWADMLRAAFPPCVTWDKLPHPHISKLEIQSAHKWVCHLVGIPEMCLNLGVGLPDQPVS